jgi:hypothetical protein
MKKIVKRTNGQNMVRKQKENAKMDKVKIEEVEKDISVLEQKLSDTKHTIKRVEERNRLGGEETIMEFNNKIGELRKKAGQIDWEIMVLNRRLLSLKEG